MPALPEWILRAGDIVSRYPRESLDSTGRVFELHADAMTPPSNSSATDRFLHPVRPLGGRGAGLPSDSRTLDSRPVGGRRTGGENRDLHRPVRLNGQRRAGCPSARADWAVGFAPAVRVSPPRTGMRIVESTISSTRDFPATKKREAPQADKGFQYPHGHIRGVGGSETRSAAVSRSSAAST